MTDKRTTLVLSVLAGLLLAFILVFERGSLSTTDVARRSAHVLPRFVRERVTRVELVRGQKPPMVLERAPAEDDGELGGWRLAAPVEADADEDAVESFLGALEWLMPSRALSGLDDADRVRFGLAEPRFVVRFRVASELVTLRVGGPSSQPEGVYVAVEGQDQAFVVGGDFLESIDHELSHFRDKDLFARDFFSTDARRVRLVVEGRAMEFEKEGPTWMVREPVRGIANAGALDRALRVTRELRALRFEAEQASELARFGLDRPWRELVVTRPEEARGTREARLRVGDVCGEHTEERYALVGDRGPVVCVLASAVAGLELSAEDAREPRLLAIGPDLVERISVAGVGPRLELTREEEGWRLTAGPGAPAMADAGAVNEWLRQLREQRALGFEPLEGEPGRGIGSPAATLTLSTVGGGADLVVRLGEASAEGVWVRRGDEAALGRFEASVGELLRPGALRFRERALVRREPADARRVVVRRGEVEERAVRGDAGAWQLEAPLRAEADRVVVRELARQVGELRAARFVATAAAPEHGLEPPRARVEVTFQPEGEEPSAVAVELGAASAEGVHARLEGQELVFEIEHGVADALDVALVSRDLLSVDLSPVDSIRIDRDGEPVADLRREGLRWLTAEGAPAHEERTRDLLERLAGLRAEGVLRYGRGADAGLGLDPPSTRITLGQPSGPITLDIGEDQEGNAPVRGSQADVVYRFRSDLVRVFRSYTP